MLVVYGTSDYVVALEDHERIVEVVNHGHPGQATLAEVEAMDHNLQVAATPKKFFASTARGTPTDYQTKFSDIALHWICAHERCTAGT